MIKKSSAFIRVSHQFVQLLIVSVFFSPRLRRDKLFSLKKEKKNSTLTRTISYFAKDKFMRPALTK